MVGLVLALIIALVYSWLLTIVLLGLVPILMFAGFLQLKALTGHATKTKKALEKAGKVSWWYIGANVCLHYQAPPLL